ncbi:HTH-type transcriptional repressor RspR [Methylobacterium crusticola]|uniref:HTH-type transcriptional repressor RspR n=1 Tax=Methylobacterium crusticola TaxID=1697972 RepID=A0ABQ4QVQ3_9HYPH|nr:GntR family transcriptional regulator [Methylobacterium crusticola]GJD49262.1 HTH-type transcriptional repressor RspR [Methylobacterium crusticola]
MEERTRAEVIAQALRKAIIEQALEPGAKLPEDVVGDTFGVSRTVARRALELLAAEELVEFRPRRGAAVSRPTLAEGRDLFAVRIDLERVVVRRLTGRLEEDQLATLARMVEHEHHAHHHGRPEYIRLAAEFHVVLGEMTGSLVLSRLLAQLVWRSALVLRLYGRPRWDSCNLQEHLDLIEALRASDAAAAEALMTTHLESVLLRGLDGGKAGGAEEPGDILRRYARADS